MGFNPKDMQKMVKQMQKMQADMARIQDELKFEKVEARAGGVVTVVFNGHGDLESITILPEAVDPNDVEMLQDLILGAVQEGQAKAQALAQERLGQVAGSLNMPGLPGF